MHFEDYKTESLERIAADPRYVEHHAKIDAILRKREGHLHLPRGIEVLTDVAKNGETTNYKIFFETCVGGDVTWNHTKMYGLAKFLGDIQNYCSQMRCRYFQPWLSICKLANAVQGFLRS